MNNFNYFFLTYSTLRLEPKEAVNPFLALVHAWLISVPLLSLNAMVHRVIATFIVINTASGWTPSKVMVNLHHLKLIYLLMATRDHELADVTCVWGSHLKSYKQSANFQQSSDVCSLSKEAFCCVIFNLFVKRKRNYSFVSISQLYFDFSIKLWCKFCRNFSVFLSLTILWFLACCCFCSLPCLVQTVSN